MESPKVNDKWTTTRGEGLVERVDPDGSGWDVRLFTPVPCNFSRDMLIHRMYVVNREWKADDNHTA